MCNVNKAFQDYVPAQERIDILNAAIERATEMKNQVVKDCRYCPTCCSISLRRHCISGECCIMVKIVNQ